MKKPYIVATSFLVVGLISGFFLSDLLEDAHAQEQCTVDKDLLTKLYNAVFNRPLDAGSDFHIGKDIRTVLSDLDNSAEKTQYSALAKAVKGFEEAKRAPGDIASSEKQQYLDLIESAVSTIAAWSETLPPQSLDKRVVGPEQARTAIQKAYEGMSPTAKQSAEYGIFNALRRIGPPSQITLPSSSTTASPSASFTPVPVATITPTPVTPNDGGYSGSPITSSPPSSTSSPSYSPTPTPGPTPTPTPTAPITVTSPNGGQTWDVYHYNQGIYWVLNGVNRVGFKLLKGSQVVYSNSSPITSNNTTLSIPPTWDGAPSTYYNSVGGGSGYKIRIFDWDNPGVYDDSDNYFTIPLPDIMPPVVSSVLASSITSNSVVITWTTDEPATGFVNYGSTPNNWVVTPTITSYSTLHSFTLSNLAAGTLYTFRVYSVDASSNGPQGYPSEHTFTTGN